MSLGTRMRLALLEYRLRNTEATIDGLDRLAESARADLAHYARLREQRCRQRGELRLALIAARRLTVTTGAPAHE